jgi:hypothetical protein
MKEMFCSNPVDFNRNPQCSLCTRVDDLQVNQLNFDPHFDVAYQNIKIHTSIWNTQPWTNKKCTDCETYQASIAQSISSIEYHLLRKAAQFSFLYRVNFLKRYGSVSRAFSKNPPAPTAEDSFSRVHYQYSVHS